MSGGAGEQLLLESTHSARRACRVQAMEVLEGNWVPDTAPVQRPEKPYKSCAAVGNSAGLLDTRIGSVIDEHEVVLRFNGAPHGRADYPDSTQSRRLAPFVGSKTTFQLLNRRAAEQLLDGAGGGGGVGVGEDSDAVLLLWRPESFAQFRELSRAVLQRTGSGDLRHPSIYAPPSESTAYCTAPRVRRPGPSV